jgi:hypothetical protein
MAIVLTLPDSFDIENYAGLQAFLVEHLQLDASTTEQLPNLIRLAEYRLNRLLLTPERETTATLTTTAGTQSVALPTGFRQVRKLKIIGDPGYPLSQVSPNVVETYDYAGRPTVFAIEGANLALGPIPDSVYTLTLLYLSRLAPLTANTQTNWLLTENADAYVFMACSMIEQHLGNAENAALYNGLAEGVCAEINAQGVRFRASTPMRLRSPVVV